MTGLHHPDVSESPDVSDPSDSHSGMSLATAHRRSGSGGQQAAVAHAQLLNICAVVEGSPAEDVSDLQQMTSRDLSAEQFADALRQSRQPVAAADMEGPQRRAVADALRAAPPARPQQLTARGPQRRGSRRCALAALPARGSD